MLFAMFLSLFYRKKLSDIWLICEDENEARDNGYYFFKYVLTNHPEQRVFYAINTDSPDFKSKLQGLDCIIKFGSLKHWIYYLCANKNISSQKGGKPNAAVCYLFEVQFRILKTNRVFLQHGITISDAKWLYYNKTRFDLFICATSQEYDFVKEKFGYPDDKIKLLGFSRFDNLDNSILNKDYILCMPSWRNWLGRKMHGKNRVEEFKNIEETEYFKSWNEFLNMNELLEFLRKKNKKIIFYPHRNMQKFIKSFTTKSENIIIANSSDYDVQYLLKKCALLITDYSSVFFDFSYMGKPVIFYQFDYEKFRKFQYQEGYFSYDKNGFSRRTEYKNEVIKYINDLYESNFELNEDELAELNRIFGKRDKNNSERIYRFLKNEK